MSDTISNRDAYHELCGYTLTHGLLGENSL
jgi:hypothetical protein